MSVSHVCLSHDFVSIANHHQLKAINNQKNRNVNRKMACSEEANISFDKTSVKMTCSVVLQNGTVVTYVTGFDLVSISILNGKKLKCRRHQ